MPVKYGFLSWVMRLESRRLEALNLLSGLHIPAHMTLCLYLQLNLT